MIASATPRRHVLVVDDDPGYLRAVRRLLRADDAVELVVATDGDSARRCAADGGLDMIVLDVYMPDLDGIAFCRQLKADARTSGTAVIVTSAAMTSELEAAARAAGASRALDKVGELDELLSEIRCRPQAPWRASAHQRAIEAVNVEAADELSRRLARLCERWVDEEVAVAAGRRALGDAVAARDYRTAVPMAVEVRRAIRGAILDEVVRRYLQGRGALATTAAAGPSGGPVPDAEHVRDLMRRSTAILPLGAGVTLALLYERGLELDEVATLLDVAVARVVELRDRGLAQLEASLN
ncbi:MAG: response regulator [Kofleriaceae bacterium]